MKRLMNTEGWLRFIGNRNIQTKQDATDYINKINDNSQFVYWVVRLKANGHAAGILTFLKRDYLPFHDIGFAFLPEYNGQGYAKEAAKEILQMLEQYPEHHVVLATTLPSNVRSIRLLKALGFIFERQVQAGENLLDVYIKKHV